MVIIKNLEMPKSCYDCELHNYHFCNITRNLVEKHIDDGTRAEDCPLEKLVTCKECKHMERDGFTCRCEFNGDIVSEDDYCQGARERGENG